jgi:hypothetical protein
MALADADDVRSIGNLPSAADGFPDTKIDPHLPQSARRLKRWIGDYSSYTGDDLAAVIEAEACLCMSYLIPPNHTFFTATGPSLQTELGELDMQFHGPDEIQTLVDMWVERARDTVREFIDDSANEGVSVVSFFAIGAPTTTTA